MSKGKHKRKKARAAQPEHQQIPDTPGLDGAVNPKTETETRAQGEKYADQKKGEPMRLRETIKAAAQRSSLTDWLLVLFTGVLAAAAIYQFVITDGQLHAMKQDQRAWVKIASPEPLATGGGQPIIAPVHLINTGKTPALNYLGEALVKILPIEQEPAFDYSQWDHGRTNGGILYTADPRDIEASMYAKDAWTTSHPEMIALSDTDYKKFLDGKAYIVVYARVTYSDIYGVNHWTHFCNWSSHAPSSPALKCSECNRVDDN